MKKLLFAIAFMTAGSVAVLAQEAQPKEQEPQTPPSEVQAPPSSDYQSQDQDKGQAIATSELPANIQASLQGADYSGWTVASAYKNEKDGKTTYMVELTKDSEKKTINFDADGNVMKDEEKPKN
ncbi:MAG TPA: hypothetical protein VFG46_00470 [Chryseolinea sp.]|nr:hypothetical protein [Chryseolinea sp.]